ncbi:MAG: sugar-binding protein [Bacteroidales bacterium]|nr:sugar-binding protein [Bacteroidales bacterium]
MNTHYFISTLSYPTITVRIALCLLLSSIYISNLTAVNPEACNDYIAYKTSEVPIFDGIGDEEFWNNANWYAIDQIWLPYNNDLNYPDATKEGSSKLISGKDDFSGKFKLAWNEEENMLYLLAVITDDVFVSGYAGTGSYSVYDVLEIFIDEDASGGEHELDLGNSIAANAFSYHINATPYGDGEIQTYMSAMDIAKKGEIVDYHNHFPYFSLRKEGNTYTYELAMKLYSAEQGIAYETDDANDYEVQLYEDKVSGFSLAYCDNDDPNNLSRDHFIGSSFLPAGKNNSNYQTADLFGKLTFKGEFNPTSITETNIEKKAFLLYPNPTSNFVKIFFNDNSISGAKISLLGIDGRILKQLYSGNIEQQSELTLPINGLEAGSYFISITTDQETKLIRFTIK